MTNGLPKSSKKKQKLYDKFLKNKTNKNSWNYKTYNNLYNHMKTNKKTWDIIKEVIGKTKLRSNILPRKLIIDGIETYDENIIL